MNLLSQHIFGDTAVRYPQDPVTGRVGPELPPTALLARADGCRIEHRVALCRPTCPVAGSSG